MLDLTIENLKTKTALALTRPMIYHPEVQHEIAEMVMEMEAIQPHIEKIAQDWSQGVDHGPAWGLNVIAAKYWAVNAPGGSSTSAWTCRVASPYSSKRGWSASGATLDWD